MATFIGWPSVPLVTSTAATHPKRLAQSNTPAASARNAAALSLEQTEIFVVNADQERLIAFLTATFMTMENRDGIED